jgi:hypothetical protein
MTKLKTLISNAAIVYSMSIGLVVVLMSTNDYFLSFIEKAAEMELNPLCFKEWLLVLLNS